jgi:integrase
MAEEVIDPHQSEMRYKHWREENKSIDGVSREASDLIFQYLDDLEAGENVARGTKKGKRSFSRIYANLIKLTHIFKILNSRKISLKDITEKNVNKIFIDMRGTKNKEGITEYKIKKRDGTAFTSTWDYAKTFIGFWHWYMRVMKKKNKEIKDITADLDTSKEENVFCYFDREGFDKILVFLNPTDALQALFQFDSIIRYPKELQNVRRMDITEENGFVWLNIREETAKTYGRRIKLMLCSDKLLKYLEENKFEPTDVIFKFSSPMFNQKLKAAAIKAFGDIMTLGGKKYSEITGYDLRHAGACFWRKGAYHTKIDALMYRGGWKDLDMLNYYTKKLGLKDSIEEEDLMTLQNKTKMEKELEQLRTDVKKQKEIFEWYIQECGFKPIPPDGKIQFKNKSK